MSDTLILTVKKNWFNLILKKEKRNEFRRPSNWIKSRLIGKEYDFIEFRNGYKKDSPREKRIYLGYYQSLLFKSISTYSDGSSVDVNIGDYVIYFGDETVIDEN